MAGSEEIKNVSQDIRDDAHETNWAFFALEGKALSLKASGPGGLAELTEHFKDDNAGFAFLRTISGDQESRRVKFVFITWIGESAGPLTKGRLPVMKGEVLAMVGQIHIELQISDKKEATEDVITRKLKAAQGADYDTGSNKTGYTSQGCSAKRAAAAAYMEKEKQGNLSKVIYTTHALPKVTPCDLSGRDTVAPASSAHVNTKDSVINTEKWKSA